MDIALRVQMMQARSDVSEKGEDLVERELARTSEVDRRRSITS